MYLKKKKKFSQILQVKYQKVQEDSGFTAEKKNCEIFNSSSCFQKWKIDIFCDFLKQIESTIFHIQSQKFQ